jgi:hypothetical protein
METASTASDIDAAGFTPGTSRPDMVHTKPPRDTRQAMLALPAESGSGCGGSVFFMVFSVTS